MSSEGRIWSFLQPCARLSYSTLKTGKLVKREDSQLKAKSTTAFVASTDLLPLNTVVLQSGIKQMAANGWLLVDGA